MTVGTLEAALHILAKRGFRYDGVAAHPPMAANTDYGCEHSHTILLRFNGPMGLLRFVATCDDCHRAVETRK